MTTYMMPPLGLKDIRDYASRFRKIFKCTDDGYINIVKIFESLQDLGVNIEIVSKETLGVKHGETFPVQQKIQIREDVYDRACDGYGRDRLTIAHEIGHLLLHGPKKISLARLASGASIPTYCDPEWQANAFAGELLAPFRFIQGLSVDEVQNKYGISAQAAQVQLRRRH